MRCYVVTTVNPVRFRILKLIDKYGWTPLFICHNSSQADTLISMRIPGSSIHVTNIPMNIQGVSLQRDYAARYVMPKGEWSLWLDDNLTDITGLRPHLSKDKLDLQDGNRNWREEYAHELTRNELTTYINETIAKAEQVGTIFAAFANENNFFFRHNKWQVYGYCRTRLALYKNDGSSWVPFDTMMLEDMAKSIDVVCRYGQVVVNRHVKASKPMFEAGGIGSFAERLPWLQDNCRKLMDMYPGLLRYAGDGKQYGLEASEFHLTFAKRSKKTIDQWRKENGYASTVEA